MTRRSIVKGLRIEATKFGKSIPGSRGSQKMHALGRDAVGVKRASREVRHRVNAALSAADLAMRALEVTP